MKPSRIVLAASAIAALLGVCAGDARAQRTAEIRVQPGAARPDSLIVSLLTFGPGPMLFDRFGHTAVRVRNSRGLDSAWNWGMYDFNSPNFITRFLTGDTQYWMAGYPTPLFVNSYRRDGRAIWEQELAIDQQAADTLLRALRWNARPENKFYRYDYYLDNCSTRARDALDLALRGALKQSLSEATPDSSVTWRKETLRSAAAFPFIGFGMTFALGRRADAVVTPWEEAFLPARLRDRLRDVRVPDLAGTHPLVRAERELNPPGPIVDAKVAPSYARKAGSAGMMVMFLLIIIGVPRAQTSGRYAGARRILGAAGTMWHFVAGTAGLLVLMAGLFTKHTFMAENLAILLGTPASLALVWFYGRGLSVTATDRTRRAAVGLSIFAAACAAAAIAIRAVVPSVAPADLAPTLFALPIHLILAVLLVMHGRRAKLRAPA